MGKHVNCQQSDNKWRVWLFGNNHTHKRARVPIRLILALVFVAIIVPAAALDEPHTLAPTAAGQHYRYYVPIGFFVTLFLLIGQSVTVFSSTLVGPMMGITSVLWLMMRNDSAISPKVSWM
jgi:hypothetical protein